MIAMIWAESQNGVIGKDGRIPWHLPNDLKFFRTITQNNIVVMGYNTYASLGYQPLPKRRNIVLGRPVSNLHKDVELMNWPRQISNFGKSDNIFIIGGKKTYDLMMPYADTIYRTVIHSEFQGDTLAPVILEEDWQLAHSWRGVTDEQNIYPHTFMKYRRKE